MKKQAKKLVTLALALLLCLSVVTGCAKPAAPAAPAEETPASDSPKKVMLVVSFGTSYNDNRDLSVGGVEAALQAAYPDYEVRRAFTSQIIIDKLKDRDGLEIDNVTQAMDRLVADGIKEVVIQPTHVMSGFEYDDVVAEVTPYKDKFDSFKIGSTLLASDADYDEVISIITEETKSYDVDGTAIVFMGHGTEHEANATYAKLQEKVTTAGHKNYFIGTVEATPSLEDVIALVKASGAKKVVLLPLMIVAGDHANNDMAGDEEDSWKSAFKAAGFEVECVLKGLGQYTGIQNLIVKHVGETIAK
jgi:sirohydrochlorin cobaltochelatase